MIRLATWIAILGPVYYVAFTTFLGLLWGGYDPVRQTQSELGSVGAPHAVLMNFGGFFVLGVVIAAFAVIYALAVRGGTWTWLATAALMVAAAGMATVSFFPCDPGCVDVTRTGELHGTFSAPGAIGLPSAAMLSATAFRRDGRLDRRWQVGSFALGAVALASGPIVAAGLLPDLDGLLQRAAMWTPTLWMSAVALRLRGLR